MLLKTAAFYATCYVYAMLLLKQRRHQNEMAFDWFASHVQLSHITCRWHLGILAHPQLIQPGQRPLTLTPRTRRAELKLHVNCQREASGLQASLAASLAHALGS